jgi:hypothetical protein
LLFVYCCDFYFIGFDCLFHRVGLDGALDMTELFSKSYSDPKIYEELQGLSDGKSHHYHSHFFLSMTIRCGHWLPNSCACAHDCWLDARYGLAMEIRTYSHFHSLHSLHSLHSFHSFYSFHSFPFITLVFISPLGACSMFGAWGNALKDSNTLLQLRALDWDMNGMKELN